MLRSAPARSYVLTLWDTCDGDGVLIEVEDRPAQGSSSPSLSAREAHLDEVVHGLEG